MKINRINPLFPSAPVLNPPPYKFKKPDGQHGDPDDVWRDSEEIKGEGKENDFFFYLFVFLGLFVLFMSN